MALNIALHKQRNADVVNCNFDDLYEWDYDDHTTPCYFAPVEVSIYNEDTDEEVEPEEKLVLCVPDMKNIQNVNFGKRSGITIIGI